MKDPIKQKIQELVPEIMELKFGCIIRNHEMTEDLKFCGESKQGGETCYIPSIDDYVVLDSHIGCEILGRPIRLADVLRAIGETKNRVACDDMGNIFELTGAGQIIMPAHFWDLSKDSYDDQSQETKKFIGELLDKR
jgi:hypothetical protein